MSEDYKRLYRSRDERMIAGVCGGIAEYFKVDPTLIRLLFVLFAMAGGPGLIAYIILAIIMPEQPIERATTVTSSEEQAVVEVEEAEVEQTEEE